MGTPPLTAVVLGTPNGSEYDRAIIAGEESIAWVPGFDPQAARYVRELVTDCQPRRRGRPRHRTGRICGWANLRAGAQQGKSQFSRRIFWLSDADPYARGGAPVEAIDPLLVQAREPGVLTERAWGRPAKAVHA